MEAFFEDTSSFYGHPNQQPPHSAPIDNTLYDFVTTSMPMSMMRQSPNPSSRLDPAFPPVDSILYSPIDDCFQVSDYSVNDSLGLQSLFSESPLMSTLERQSTNASTSDPTPSSQSPRHDHINVDGWEPTPETKRSRPGDADSKSACWTSPLCPAYGKPGPHPNPSSCEGGCASNVFDDQSMDQWLDSFAKANDGAGFLDTPSTTAIPDPLDMTGSLLSASPAELKTIKEEEQEEVAEPTTVTRSKKRPGKRTSSESSSSPDPIPAPSTKAAPAKTSRRQPHNEIEKKYRESINTHLEALKNSIPAFQQSKNAQCMHGKGDIEDLAAAPKPSKSIILASAVAHIKKIEKEKRQLEQERNLLRQQVKALQALVKCDDCSVMNYVAGLNGLNLGNTNNGRGMGRMS